MKFVCEKNKRISIEYTYLHYAVHAFALSFAFGVRRNAGQEGLLFYVNMQHKHFYQLMGMSKFLTLTQRIAVRITVQIYAELYALWVVI
ncbi:hypothetical protein ASU99_05360 [Enterobacter hormaechei subsp. steigerwaltii]|nr:hypothetical protein ASU99_05360 [Enterobacter hormaechei subsp. steigerwaltii]